VTTIENKHWLEKQRRSKMEEKSRSNDDVYEDWVSYIKKRNNYYKETKSA